jgi:hypothetical protein
MEHDAPTLLFRLACEHLISARVIRPGVVRVMERIATAREAASRETFDRVVHLLTTRRQGELDELRDAGSSASLKAPRSSIARSSRSGWRWGTERRRLAPREGGH